MFSCLVVNLLFFFFISIIFFICRFVCFVVYQRSIFDIGDVVEQIYVCYGFVIFCSFFGGFMNVFCDFRDGCINFVFMFYYEWMNE